MPEAGLTLGAGLGARVEVGDAVGIAVGAILGMTLGESVAAGIGSGVTAAGAVLAGSAGVADGADVAIAGAAVGVLIAGEAAGVATAGTLAGIAVEPLEPLQAASEPINSNALKIACKPRIVYRFRVAGWESVEPATSCRELNDSGDEFLSSIGIWSAVCRYIVPGEYAKSRIQRPFLPRFALKNASVSAAVASAVSGVITSFLRTCITPRATLSSSISQHDVA